MKLFIVTNIISLVAGFVLCCLVLKLTEFPKFIKDIWAKFGILLLILYYF